MIVFDLICADGEHRFEGWFGSSKDYEEQLHRGLLTCPVCAGTNIAKAAMAPSVGRKGNQQAVAAKSTDSRVESHGLAPVSNKMAMPAEYQEMIGKLAKAQANLLVDSEWVGDKFAERARDIHYGDEDEKSIHGTATQEDVADLVDEGIAALPLPLPVIPPGTKN
ncbi:DUF1178 family protein [Parasphingorhabdus sp.]|uniref:DUF1178 family protein n=1 Tax=Parasphingorhabdus sp. TaxID=2709688 RepID=UPI003A8E2F02